MGSCVQNPPSLTTIETSRRARRKEYTFGVNVIVGDNNCKIFHAHWVVVQLICRVHPRTVPLKWRHDDVIKWIHFPRYWPFVRGIHRSPVNSPHKGQWRGALIFTLICARINGWVNNREAGDLRRYRPHYDVIVMDCSGSWYQRQAQVLASHRQCLTYSHIPAFDTCFWHINPHILALLCNALGLFYWQRGNHTRASLEYFGKSTPCIWHIYATVVRKNML